MRRSMLALLSLLFAVVATAAAAQQEKYTLAYNPEVGLKWEARLSGVLTDIQLQGQSLGVRGDVASKYVSQVTSKDEGKKECTVQVAVSDLAANLNGNATTPQSPQPIELRVDRKGAVSDVKGNEDAAVGFMDTGGVPIMLVAILAQTVRFGDEAVAVNDEWQFEDKYLVPGLGEVPINTRWQLAAVDGKVATLRSSAAAALPTFRVPNPMAPGTEMDVKAGQAFITELEQQYDMETSQLRSSQGKLKIAAQLDMQGMAVPVVLTMNFSLTPVEKATEPAR